MSTTFEVYPGKKEIPSFGQLLEKSSTELHRFLGSVAGIRYRPEIHVSLLTCENNQPTSLALAQPAIWPETVYAWFRVGAITGGTDAYFRALPTWRRAEFEESMQTERFLPHRALVHCCLDVGHYWLFRRSMGQPAIINLSYGLIAASLALLTDGFLYSDDSAWDWQRFPATPQEFLSWYFVPALALNEDKKEWSAQCIAGIAEELAGHQ